MKLPVYPLRGKDIYVCIPILQYFIAYGEIKKLTETKKLNFASRAYTTVEQMIPSNLLYLVEVQLELFFSGI